MTSKQRANLRALAAKEETIFQIGKDNVSANLITSIGEALNKRELIKLTVLKTCELTPREAADRIARQTGAEVIATIGNKLILYKRSTNKAVKHLEF